MTTLSVVVPAFNEAELIGQCLDGLVKQTRAIDEIVVVDNGSTDGTAAIVDSYVNDHNNVTRVVEKEPGVIHARRCGFDFATGDVIAKTDADSLVAPDWAERIVNFFDSSVGSEFAALTGLVLCWDGPSRGLQHKLMTMTLGRLAEGGTIGGLGGPNYAVRNSAWKEVSDTLQTDPDTWEDLDLSLALSEAGYKMYFDPGLQVDASCRQLRHSPWQNRSYISGGVRTAARRGNDLAVKALRIQRPFRFVGFTAMWLLFRPWDHEKRNWRPHRLLTPGEASASGDECPSFRPVIGSPASRLSSLAKVGSRRPVSLWVVRLRCRPALTHRLCRYAQRPTLNLGRRRPDGRVRVTFRRRIATDS
ncbi:glycosyltransferase [Gordonia amicalis]|nr:glycosyltransferase family 2 protein [Gordonia amicalis]UOG22952.1 glycosyltransferase [Gordonia amicalis]